VKYFYEVIQSDDGIPVKAFVHSINTIELHWHDQIEILLVLQGSVHVRERTKSYLLKENDLILFNSNEIHNTSRTDEDNMLLALQISPEYCAACCPGFKRMVFDCKSFLARENDRERFDEIRRFMTRIVWELNKKKKGYQLTVGSEINLLAAYLINHFDCHITEDKNTAGKQRDIARLRNILHYIDEHADDNVTLQGLADREHLNPCYLSHFIREKMGMSFQQYLNHVRLDRAVNLLTNTDRTITEISYASGYPSIKAFNRNFKAVYRCSPKEYRNGNHLSPGGKWIRDDPGSGEKRSRTYLDVDRNAALKKLFSYLKTESSIERAGDTRRNGEVVRDEKTVDEGEAVYGGETMEGEVIPGSGRMPENGMAVAGNTVSKEPAVPAETMENRGYRGKRRQLGTVLEKTDHVQLGIGRVAEELAEPAAGGPK